MIDMLMITKEVLFEGLGLFASPFLHPIMLWVVVPILINLFATEIFQERGGTSMGNAMTNGVVAIWVGIDWIRNVMMNYAGATPLFLLKAFLCFFMFVFGIAIIFLGVRGSKIIRYIGRIREITYFNLVLTPIIYGFYPFSLLSMAAIIVYFPIFYVVVAIIDRITPTFKFEKEDAEVQEGTQLPRAESEAQIGTGFEELHEAAAHLCPYCDSQLRFIPQYQKYWCDRCRRYV